MGQIATGIRFFIGVSVILYGLSGWTMDYETLKNIIITNKVNSIEKLLPLLPANVRSKYVVVFRSRSLQSASYKNPRVIFYADNAKFMLSFNGDENQRGFYELEVAEFDSEKKEFNYREIIFPGPGSVQTAVSFSEANPATCLKCHTEPARPIWDSHPIWPGAYGQIYHTPLSNSEEAGLKEFLAAQPNHPRYRYLTNIEYIANRETYFPRALNKYEGKDQNLPPNAALGVLLGHLNFEVIAKQVATAKNFSDFQYTLLAALDSDCGDIDNYVPLSLQPGLQKKLKQFAAEADAQNAEADKLKLARLADSKNFSLAKEDRVDLNNFRFFVENGLGLSTENWTTALEKRSYDFSAPKIDSKDLERVLLPYVIQHDSELKHALSLRRVSSSEQFCNILKKNANLSKMTLRPLVSQLTEAKNSPPILLKKCAGCHQGAVAYKIPFDNPSELTNFTPNFTLPRGSLQKEILYRLSIQAGADNMPRGLIITADERRSLEKYFKNTLQH